MNRYVEVSMVLLAKLFQFCFWGFLATVLVYGAVIDVKGCFTPTHHASTVAAPHPAPGTTWVKYRSTPVDLSDPRFAYLDTSRSSLVGGAWYDASNSYMVIRLTGTYYHYCGLPESEWRGFRTSDSFGKYYLAHIKGHYDCRLGHVPTY